MSEVTVWLTDRQEADLAAVAQWSGRGATTGDIVRKAVARYLSDHPWLTSEAVAYPPLPFA